MSKIFLSSNYFFNIYALPYFISGILMLAESIYIFLQNKKSPLNISFSLGPFFAAVWLTGVGLTYSSLSESIASLWSNYYCWFGIIFVSPAVYFFSVVWRGKFVREKIKYIYVNFIAAMLVYIICFSSKYIIQGVWTYPWGFYPKAGAGEFPFIIWFYTVMTLSFKNFIRAYKEEMIPIRKQQTKLIIIAFLFGFLGSLDFIQNFGISFYTFGALTVLPFPTMVGYAVIRYKLMEIETVMHKTIAWFFTNIIFIIPFVVLMQLTKMWYIHLNILYTYVLLGGLFLAFLLFIRIFQPKIDHFFQRDRYDLEDAANRFTGDLVRLKGLNQLIQRIHKTIADEIYSQHTAVYVSDDNNEIFRLAGASNHSDEIGALKIPKELLLWFVKNDKIIYKEFVEIDPGYSSLKEHLKAYFNSTGAIVIIPLVLNERLIGVINLAKKTNLSRYRAVDFHFLNLLKNQSAIALLNSLLYQNIEGQVRQRTKELVDIQKQLVHAEKLATLGTLAGGVAHEINNPLTAILTNVQMLIDYSSIVDAEDKESLQLIEEATKRCKSIVDKLMLYGRKQDSSSTFSRVDLSIVIKNVISLLNYQFNQDNVTITTEFKGDNFWITGNHNELEQVVTNIILNAKDAVKQVKKSGNICISLLESNNWVKISIQDDGAGISKELLPKIFDPFFTTKEVGKGTGLGLSISQAIIEKHNGVIMVESEPNKGAIFTIQLPVEWENSLKK